MLRNLLFWMLLPLVFPQAMWVKQTAPRFAGAQGPNHGTVGQGKPLNLCAVGDSIIAGVGARVHTGSLIAHTAGFLAALLNLEVRWQSSSRIGANAGEVLQSIVPDIDPGKADLFVLSVGVNDVTSLTTLAGFRQHLTGILTGFETHSPQALTAVIGMPPLKGFPLLPQPLRAVMGIRADSLDQVMREVVDDFELALYVPVSFTTDPEKFSADGYHPSEESYREFGGVVAGAIAQAGKTVWTTESA